MSDSGFRDALPPTAPSSPPPQQTLEWVAQQVGQPVAAVEALVGGMSSAVHRLQLANGSTVVLRRYTLADWLDREPEIPFDEARNLALLDELNLGTTTPALVAADPDAVVCDVPAIVMTHVAGQPEIDPLDPMSWAERLAECLAGIHKQSPVDGLGDYQRWDDPNRLVPTWTRDPAMWVAAIDRAKPDLPAHPHSFLHRDFHPNNIHWLDGKICAVVDWLGACNGPVAGDLAHCRWNVAMLAAPAIAEHFTDHYRAQTGYSEDTRAFDLATVLSGPVGSFPTHAWNALGRADLTSDVVAHRVDDWLELLLQP